MNAEERIYKLLKESKDLDKVTYGDMKSVRDGLTKAILSIDQKELVKYSFCGTVEYPTVDIEWKE